MKLYYLIQIYIYIYIFIYLYIIYLAFRVLKEKKIENMNITGTTYESISSML